MRITNLNKLTKKGVIFHDAVVNQHGNKSINIEVKTPEGKLEPLVIESPLLFSFGVQESVNEENGEINGYSIPTCLWSDSNKKERTQAEIDFYTGLKKIQMFCVQHLDKIYAKNFKIPVVTRDEKPPVLYSKLIFSKKLGKIYTLFHSRESDKLNPFDYLNQYCKVKMSLMIESIYIGDNTVSLQIKVNDVFVKPLKTRPKLVSPPDDEEDD